MLYVVDGVHFGAESSDVKSALFTFWARFDLHVSPHPVPTIDSCNTSPDYCNFLNYFYSFLAFPLSLMAVRRSARLRRAQESPEVSTIATTAIVGIRVFGEIDGS